MARSLSIAGYYSAKRSNLVRGTPFIAERKFTILPGMSYPFADIAFTPAVQQLQERYGSRARLAQMQARGARGEALGPQEADFLARADSFYLATVGETGWPYVQHRGGPTGFFKVLSPVQLAFADFRGNLQYVSAGNAAGNARASIIVMDYAERSRLKLLGMLRFIEIGQADAALVSQVSLPGYAARVERVALLDLAGFDWNCSQHITQRFTLEQLREAAAA
jgi:uncharacterized protein